MSQQATIKRFLIILELVEHRPYISFEQLTEQLIDAGHRASRKTLQRDIEALRNELGVEIQYSRAKNGYFINEQNSLDRQLFNDFLQTTVRMNILNQSMKDSKNMMQYISYDTAKNFKGLHTISRLLDAAIQHRKIEFEHYNFYKKTTTQHTLHPYHIKEYQNRWYVVGYTEKYSAIRIFGIDRIEKIKVLDALFKTKNFDPETYFENMIGVYKNEDKPVIVKLKCTQQQSDYLQSLPLHASQISQKADDTHYLFTYYLKPNYELIQQLLSMGSEVEVLMPLSLRSTIKQTYTNTLAKYEIEETQ